MIFDLRGYPIDTHDVISHLNDQPVQSAIWQVARTIYPDREKPAGFETGGRWRLEPRQPRIQKAAFLINAAAISYAESILGIVENYHLAELVGEATAGANGNVNSVILPGHFAINFTGMRVLKHDGSQHHLIGISDPRCRCAGRSAASGKAATRFWKKRSRCCERHYPRMTRMTRIGLQNLRKTFV